jgi:hypothetical protein
MFARLRSLVRALTLRGDFEAGLTEVRLAALAVAVDMVMAIVLVLRPQVFSLSAAAGGGGRSNSKRRYYWWRSPSPVWALVATV